MNLIEPLAVGPADAVERVRAAAATMGAVVAGTELVGLVPDAVLRAVPAVQWAELDLADGPHDRGPARAPTGAC